MTTEVRIKVKRLRDVEMPEQKTKGAVGFDLYAAIDEPLQIRGAQWEEIPTGIAVEIPPGWQIAVRGRSGLAFHGGLSVLHGVGTIDADYRGEIRVPLINHSSVPYTVRPGDRIAQMIVQRAHEVELVEVDELSETERGIRGMGSTGV